MLNKMIELKKAYLKNEDGATAIEYGLIAAGISVAIAGVVWLLGDDLLALFQQIQDGLSR
jgi:pilus assembly protein Flp/PilA